MSDKVAAGASQAAKDERKSPSPGDGKGRSRSRERSPDRSRERSKDRSHRHRRHRSRSRSGSRSPRRSRSRDRRRRRRRHSRSRSRDRSRSRSRSRDRRKRGSRRRHSSRSRSRSRDGSGGGRGRHPRRRSRSRSRSQSGSRSKAAEPRPPTPPEERERRRQEQELMNLTRDARTVFVSQIVVRAKEKHVKKFFEMAGPVVDVKLIRDKHSGRSKGFGYVEMKNLEDVQKALLLNGQPFAVGKIQSPFPILVKPSEAEKNYLHDASAKKPSTAPVPVLHDPVALGLHRIHIGDLHINTTEEDLTKLFSPYGELRQAHIPRDEAGRSRGYGFVHFMDPMAAHKALTELNGHELGGRLIKLSAANESTAAAASLPSDGSWKLEHDEGDSGLALNPHARLALMSRLAKSEDVSSAVAGAAAGLGLPMVAAANAAAALSGGAPGLPGAAAAPPAKPPVEGAPSLFVLLKNMFDPATEEGDSWDVDIRDDVMDECSRHGQVTFCAVDKRSLGLCGVVFQDVEAAKNAADTMNGRFFAGRQIGVAFLTPKEMLLKFPAAKDAVSAASS